MKQTKKLTAWEKKMLTARGEDPKDWRSKLRAGHGSILVNTTTNAKINLDARQAYR